MTGFGFFQDLLTSIMAHGSRLPIPGMDRTEGKETSLAVLVEAVLNARGETSALVHAERLLCLYERSHAEQRLAFFELLLVTYDLDPVELAEAARAYQAQRSEENFRRLTAAAEPGRQELFRRLNAALAGTVRLVKMRVDLLQAIKTSPQLKPVDLDLRHLFRSWFNRGFLVMRPIDWKTPANILAKIIAYEAVHEIGSWNELRLRMEPSDRRCFAFFHPAMQDEPLIFVEVALADYIPDNIASVLSPERECLPADKATAAIFYSISNCQRGLAGISFGSFLIKQVAHELKSSLPGLKDFVTLSPVPGFMGWLRRQETGNPELLTQLQMPDWPGQPGIVEQLSEQLPALAAEYLLEAKAADGQPLDPVARFHLGNGARLERVNFMGDVSAKGLATAGSMMVNYYYDLAKAEQYHEAYAEQNALHVAKGVTRLLKKKEAAK